MAKTQEQQGSGGQSPMGFLKMIPGPIGQLANFKENAKKYGKEYAKQIAQKMAKEFAKRVVKQVAQKIAIAILTNPYVLAAIAIVIAVVVIFIIIIGVISGQGNSSTNGASAQQGPPPSVYTFVALGDSLTAWPCDPVTFGCVDSNPWGSYRFTGDPWPTYLTTGDPSLKLLHNAGVPAETTTQILSRFQSDVATLNPDILFILGGTNDTGKGINTIANLKQIISDAQGANIKKVIVLTIPNQCNPISQSPLNSQIKGLASTTSNTFVIDINNALTCGVDYQADGLHFTNAGAKAVADYIDTQVHPQGIIPAPAAQPGPPPSQSPSEVAYCQGREAWSSQPYDSGNIGGTGCVPTSMAMILSSYGG